MLCPKCSYESRFRERDKSRKCPRCPHHFALEPRLGDVCTDQALRKAAARLGQTGRVRYLPRQLYYQLARTRLDKITRDIPESMAEGFLLHGFAPAFGLACLIWLVLVLGLTVTGEFFIAALVIAGAALIGPVVGLTAPNPRLVRYDWPAFEAALAKWQARFGRLPGLMRSAQPGVLMPEPGWRRILVCDSGEIAAFLATNDFPREQACAILVREPDAVKALMTLNPHGELPVFLLHDASPSGCDLLAALRREGLPDEWRVRDLGLTPDQAYSLRGRWQKAIPAESVPLPGLSEDDEAWLLRYRLELAAVPPHRLLSWLSRELTRFDASHSISPGGS